MKVLWITGVLALSAGAEPLGSEEPAALPEAPLALFQNGNEAYAEGDYETAIASYQGIVAAGVENGTVLFNLGNAHHKQGDLGRAILAYERARRLIPRDRDLRENRDYLDVLKHDKSPEASTGVRAVRRAVHSLTVSEAARAALALWIVLGLLLTLRILARGGRRARRPLEVAAIAILVLLVGALCHTGYLIYEQSRPDAIVIAEQVAIRSGPSEGDVTEFKLHAGTRVRLGRHSGDWVQVALSEELRGWCRARAVEGI